MNNTETVFPSVAALELTYHCNHECFFCSCPWEANQQYKTDELSLQEWKQVINLLADNGVSAFTLTGGEPLMREDLKEIIDYIIRSGRRLTLISNGRLVSNQFLDFIAERSITLCISLPGIATYEEHTKDKNVEHTLSLFEEANKRGIRTTANITVTKKNLNELFENISFPLIKGATYVLLNRFLPGGRGLQYKEFLLNKDEVNYMLNVAEEVLEKAGKYGHIGTELPYCIIKEPTKYKRLQIGTKCSAAKNFFVVDPSGYIKVCNHSPTRLCKFTDYKSLSNNPYWLKFRNARYIPAMCSPCNNLEICDGGCREAAHVCFGKVTDNDPLFCNDLFLFE